jgi:hypothetical protein
MGQPHTACAVLAMVESLLRSSSTLMALPITDVAKPH